VSRMLESHRYRVLTAESALDALRLLETDARIDLLLTDVVMPAMSGPQLTERATALRPQLRVLYMSGYPQDLWERGGLDAGAPMIEKPFDAEQLLRKVTEAVG
jgi:CheY-like chemotaxis protein